MKSLQKQMEKQTGISELFTERVDSGVEMSNQRSEEGKTDPLTTPGGIPETKLNKEGYLEIFESYESGSEDTQPSAPLPKPHPKPQVKPKSSLQYVDFDFGRTSKKKFAKAKSPADLRKAIDASIEENQEEVKVQPPQMVAQQAVESVFESPIAEKADPIISSQIVEKSAQPQSVQKD